MAPRPELPWLWLFGASGAGKSVVGFELYRQFAAEGRRVAFVDLDQIGMCLPDDDPIRAPIKTANLRSALRNFADVGAEGVVVGGDLCGPPTQGILDLATKAPPRTVRLRASVSEYERRLRHRGAPESYVAWSQTYDTRFPRAGDINVETEGRSVAEVARAVRRQLPGWPPRHAPGPERLASTRARCGGHAVLLAGPTPVGKSTVAWELFMGSAADGVVTGFLDLAQIGFLHAPGNPQVVVDLKARNLAAMWDNFARRGAQRLILNGHLDHATAHGRYRDALGSTGLSVCVLTANADTLLARALLRGRGHAPELPGDLLVGQPQPRLEAIVRQAATAVLHQPHLPTAHYLDTDRRDPGGLAKAIADRVFGVDGPSEGDA